ncbi:MerR family transcriptional regulator [Pseudactinotalea sp. Z1739]|uniref:MerR family transcriptional regulator n=1 Tax=Pseudactinotalea sp. Z1739 TaxID=3413028 RepID=UPI003C79A226
MSEMHAPLERESIGEVAHRTGIPVETLRFYDRSGLLGDLPRTAGGHRAFDAAALGLLDVVIRLRRTGMPVSQVRDFVALVRTDTDRAGRIEILRAHRARVVDQISQLQGDLGVIDWKISAYTAAEQGREIPEPPARWPAVTDLLPPLDDLRAGERTGTEGA